MAYHWLSLIQNALLPPTCILCGNAGEDNRDLCHFCYLSLPRNQQCCYQCAAILETPSAAPVLCGRCLSLNPAFDETYAPYRYQGALPYLIGALKFSADYKNARLLGRVRPQFYDSLKKQIDIIPIF